MVELCKTRQTCRLCECSSLENVFNLTPTPPANAFVPRQALEETQAVFPLDIYFCNNCAHIQLLDVVDPSVLFENYVYVSGTSSTFVQHFANYAGSVTERYGSPNAESLVVDIGSNDGTLLAEFMKRGLKGLGIDPARDIAAQATANGIETIPSFFSPALADELVRTRGHADIVAANNVFAHADDLKGIVEGVRHLLNSDGVFIFEVSYLADVYEKTLFDTIYHEHLAYHSVKPLKRFFADNGMDFFGAERVDSHGGSFRGHVQHQGGPHKADGSVEALVEHEEGLGLDHAATFIAYAAKIDALKTELGSLLRDLKSNGKSIVGFGAPAKATTLMYHFGIGTDLIDFIIDDSPLKQGLLSPGLHVPILDSSALYDNPPDAVVILAWNFAEPIMNNHVRYLDQGGQFIVPLPTVEVIKR